MKLEDVPVQIRAEVAWWEIRGGENPYDALHAALWPQRKEDLGAMRAAGFCRRGHAMTAENTYVRPNGWRMCRACRAQWKRENKERLGTRV